MKYKTSLNLSLLFLGIAVIIPIVSVDALLSMALPLFIPAIMLVLLLSVSFAIVALVKKRTIAAMGMLLVGGFVLIFLADLVLGLVGFSL